MNNHFTIFSAGRDCAPLVRHNVASVIDQTYDNYSHIVCVDHTFCDDHATIDEAMKYDKGQRAVMGQAHRFGKLRWMREVLKPHPDSIIVILDLDDQFNDREVLWQLNAQYQDPDVWATYGQYVVVQDGLHGSLPGHCRPWLPGEKPRQIPWIFSHLRTFRASLWAKVKDEDLRGPDGNYLMAGEDMAVMWPMVEMAGRRRVRFIDRPMVRYTLTTANTAPEWRAMQQQTEAYLRAKPPYEELP